MHSSRLDYRNETDESLVWLAQAGENGAFAELIGRYHKNCEKVAFSILRDKQDAEDEVQNACWKAYEHLGQFQCDSKFSTWLTRIVVNQCLMRLRRARRARFVYLDEEPAAADARALDLRTNENSPEQVLGRTQVAEVLEREISRIPPLLRHVFILRHVHQLPMPDVAAKLGISVAAAKSRLLRARLELRNRLTKHQGRLGAGTLTA